MRTKLLKKAGAAVMSAAMLLNGAVYSTATVTAADAPLKFEFEDAKVTGDVTVEKDAKASGGSMLKMTDSGTITLKVTVDKAGPLQAHILRFWYRHRQAAESQRKRLLAGRYRHSQGASTAMWSSSCYHAQSGREYYHYREVMGLVTVRLPLTVRLWRT